MLGQLGLPTLTDNQMMTRWTTSLLVLIAGSYLFPFSSLLADEKGMAGSVTFYFDGGTLLCTFGKSNRDQMQCVAMIVFPASVDRFSKPETPIDKNQKGSIVLVSDSNGKFVQLTPESLHGWSKARISAMAGRQTSVAENAFVAAVVHTISTGTPIEIWASKAQEMLESGHWNKLFDSTIAKADPFDDPFK